MATDSKIDGVKEAQKSFSSKDPRYDTLASKVDGQDKKITKNGEDFAALSKLVTSSKDAIEAVHKAIDEHEHQIDGLDSEMGALNKSIPEIKASYTTISTELTTSNQKLDQFEQGITKLGQDVQLNTASMTSLQSKNPIHDFFAVNKQPILIGPSPMSLIDSFCISAGQIVEFVAQVSVTKVNQQLSLVLGSDVSGALARSSSEASEGQQSMTIYVRHMAESDETVKLVMFTQNQPGPYINVSAMQYGIRIYDKSYSLDSVPPSANCEA